MIRAILLSFALCFVQLFVQAETDQLCLGRYFSCYLVGGRPYCWGNWVRAGMLREQEGDYYVGDEAGEKAQPLAITGISKIFCGRDTLFAVTTGGDVVCHGRNNNRVCALGQDIRGNVLSTGQIIFKGYSVAKNMTVKLLSAANKTAGIQVTQAGAMIDRNSACFLFSNNKVKCTGDDGNFALGRAFGSVPNTAIEEQIPWVQYSGADLAATKIKCGYYHCCALTTGGDVVCWGQNGDGQLGQGNNANSLPVKVNLKNNTDNPSVPACSSVTQLSIAQYTTCVLCADTQVRCWGGNGNGEATGTVSDGTWGDETTEMSSTRVPKVFPVGTGLNVTKVSVVLDAVWFGFANGRWKGFGRSLFNGASASWTSGNPDLNPYVDFGQFNSTMVEIVGSTSSNVCGLNTAGEVRCWAWRYGAGTSDAIGAGLSDSYIGDNAGEMANLKKIEFMANGVKQALSIVVVALMSVLFMFVA